MKIGGNMMDDQIKRMTDKLLLAARILDVVQESDYDFYTKMCRNMSDEEYEEFCKEFPEAKEIDRSVLGCKHDV